MLRAAAIHAIAVAALLAGCGGMGPDGAPGPGPSPAPTVEPTACPQVIVAPPKLVSPAPGATGVDPAVGTVVLTGAPPSETVRLTSSAGTVAGGPIVSSANGIQETSAIPVLASATTYTVIVDNIPGYCGGPSTSATLGTFTTR